MEEVRETGDVRQKRIAAAAALDTRLAGLPMNLRCVLLILLVTPSILAILTYQAEFSFLWTRYWAPPVLLAEIAIIVCAGFAGFRPLRTFSALSPTARATALLFVIGVSLSAIFATAIPFMAKFHAMVTLLHCLFFLALWHMFSGDWKGHVEAILAATAVGIAVLTVVVYLLLLRHQGDLDFAWKNVGPVASNVRHYGYVGAPGCGLGAGLLAASTRRDLRWLGWACCTISLALLMWTGTRGGVIASLLAMVSILALVPAGDRLRIALAFVLSFAVAIPLSIAWIPPDPTWGIFGLTERIVDNSGSVTQFTSNRTFLWADAWQGFLERPLVGHGEGQFRWLSEYSNGRANHPHSVVFQLLFQWGLLGTLALAVLHFIGLPKALRGLQQRPHTALPALGGLVGLGVMAAIDGPLFYVLPTAIYLVLLAALFAETSPREVA
jgi:O-antigen ligase